MEELKLKLQQFYDEDFTNVLIDLLSALGYTSDIPSDMLVLICAKEVVNELFYKCNIGTIPTELYEKLSFVISARVFNSLKAIGMLHIDFDKAIQSLHMGDTTTTFVNGVDAETQFITWCANTATFPNDIVCSFRKLKW